jgi:hypothetical protein
MREDLQTPEIKSTNYETFTPEIKVYNSITNMIDPDLMPTLDGYYGVKLKEGATTVLMGDYTPIYAHWEYGKGRVGTFACDLNGTWSSDFVNSEVGETLINNIIYYLFPKERIRLDDITVGFTGDNYTTNLSIFTDLKDGEKIQVSVFPYGNPESPHRQQFTLNQQTGFSRLTFAVKQSGVHQITVQKLDSANNEISSTTVYKSLAYSKEYLAFRDEEKAQQLMIMLSGGTDGVVVREAKDVFDNAVKYLHIIIDPRIVFALIIGFAFLLDIAARKFKWKWPHEIVRDRRRREEQLGSREGNR